MREKPGTKTITLKGVNKSFSQGGEVTHALKDIDFETSLGELVMIVGPSGSGKTTLLSVIAGTLSCDSGSIQLFDFPLTDKSAKEVTQYRKENIGFIFQQFHLIPTLTCQENVSIPLLLNEQEQKIANERALEALDEVGIADKAKNLPKQLSGGQQQRVAIARALVHHPHLIICDEPTSALDAETGAHVMELIHDLAIAKDRAVIVVTHDARIFKYAHRMTNMDDGNITEGLHEA